MTSNARPQAAHETALFQGRDSCSCSSVQRSSVYISREVVGTTSTAIRIEDKNEHLANVA